MSLLQAVIIAILQGITELFPISSFGHAVIFPKLLGWAYDQRDPSFLPFLVMLHLGTAIALLSYFWHDWFEILRGILGRFDPLKNREMRRLLLLILVATIPAAILGKVFLESIRLLFANPTIAAIFLIVNAAILFIGERLRRRAEAAAPVSSSRKELAAMNWRDATLIGLSQCLSFLPGISRAGTTIVGGLLCGLTHEASARFSFLIATPIIFGANLITLPKLLGKPEYRAVLNTAIIASVVAGITAFLSVTFLMRYFKRHEFKALDPFAIYCALAGIGTLCYFTL